VYIVKKGELSLLVVEQLKYLIYNPITSLTTIFVFGGKYQLILNPRVVFLKYHPN
jgi:hypothetical protein